MTVLDRKDMPGALKTTNINVSGDIPLLAQSSHIFTFVVLHEPVGFSMFRSKQPNPTDSWIHFTVY